MEDLYEGKVKPDMDPKAVYEMHDEYKQYKKNNFTSNFRTMKGAFLDDKARSDADQAAFEHDQKLPPIQKHKSAREYPRWHRSEAYYKLKEDHAAGTHKEMKPQVLWAIQSAYQHFPKDVFRGHIHQLTGSATESHYWKRQKEKNMAINKC